MYSPQTKFTEFLGKEIILSFPYDFNNFVENNKEYFTNKNSFVYYNKAVKKFYKI